jgi:uncharacterized OB-fold protein
MAKPRADCPDCNVPLEQVKLIDATMEGETGAGHVTLAYADVGAKRSAFLRAIKRSGVLIGMMCPDCGRVLLYGEPKA